MNESGSRDGQHGVETANYEEDSLDVAVTRPIKRTGQINHFIIGF